MFLECSKTIFVAKCKTVLFVIFSLHICDALKLLFYFMWIFVISENKNNFSLKIKRILNGNMPKLYLKSILHL